MNSPAPLQEPQTPIFRVKAGESRLFHIQTDDLLGICTHWLGRTRLCTTHTDCPGCFAGVVRRWTGYIPVADHRKVQGLLEISASNAGWWEREIKTGKLFNQIAKVSRVNRFGGLMLDGVKPAPNPVDEPVKSIEAWRWMLRIIGLPMPRPGEDAALWERRVTEAAHAALQRDLGSRNAAIV